MFKWSIVVLSGMMASLVVFAGGAGVGNGGDRYAIEFVYLAHQVVDEVKAFERDHALSFDSAALEAALGKILVESTDRKLVVQDALKDAMNFPEENPPRIVLNRKAWDKRKTDDARQRRQLVLHELLGIMKVDDSRLQVSSTIYAGNLELPNPCADDERNLYAYAVSKWNRSGHHVTERNIDVSNGGRVDGVYISVVRGYEIKDGEYIRALLYAAQCNSRTGKYQRVFYSGSSASLVPSCEGRASKFCTGL